jgi:prefoldin alpha subunit
MQERDRAEKYSLLQKLAAEYEYLGSLGQVIEDQIKLVQAAEIEIITTLNSIKELNEKGSGRETLVPLGSGVLAKMQLVSYQDLLVLLGLNVYARMKIDDVSKYLESRMSLLRQREAELVQEYNNTAQRIQLLQPKISRLVQELEQGQ